MEHDKTLVLRNLILRDYSVVRDEMKKRNKSLFDDFVELERQKKTITLIVISSCLTNCMISL